MIFLILFLSCLTLIADPVSESWVHPDGVPPISFGLTNTVMEYAQDGYIYNSLPYTTNGLGQPYTHYIDNTHVNATDTANTYGSPSTPRLTWPRDVPPGSIVEIHGGPYNFNNSEAKEWWSGNGTERPIYFRGVSTNERPIISSQLGIIAGTNIIVENINFYNAQFCIRALNSANVENIAIRNCIATGAGNALTDRTWLQISLWEQSLPYKITNILIINNLVHDLGDWEADNENDASGIEVNGDSPRNIYVIDNEFYHCQGDAIRTGNNNLAGASGCWIARNYFYENKENAVDCKRMDNVAVIGNRFHTFRYSASSEGVALVAHYNPTNIWFVNNIIYGCNAAIECSGATYFYVVGNIIHGITHNAADTYPLDNAYATGEGVRVYASTNAYIMFNTFYSYDIGIQLPNPTTSDDYFVGGNLFANRNTSDGFELVIPTNEGNIVSGTNIFDSGLSVKIKWNTSTLDLTELQALSEEVGSIYGNVLLSDPTNNFSLQNGSLAIDVYPNAGFLSNTYSNLYGIGLTTDLNGGNRPINTIWDLGALEYGNGKTNSVITWTGSTNIIYPTMLTASATATWAEAAVDGVFTFSPTNEAVLPWGTNVITITFDPTDTNTYNQVVTTANVVVAQADPEFSVTQLVSTLTHPATFSTNYFTPSSVQDAAFTYSRSEGSSLSIGNNSVLITCSATDTNYFSTNITFTISVTGVIGGKAHAAFGSTNTTTGSLIWR